MKHLLITTIAAVLVVGCGESTDISIWIAAATGNIEAVKQHLAAGSDVNAKGEWDRTPLHLAALEGRKETAGLLIAEGADVNAGDDDGRTPLLFAAANGHKEVATLLITRGADVNAKAVDGETPLDRATMLGSPFDITETADLLRKHGGKTGDELKAEGIDNTDHQNKTE